MPRVVAHVDMDAFFASIEVREHPEYRGQPLIVGGERNSRRGVVSTCSYEARRFGVRSAMPIRKAVELCPQGLFIPPNLGLYRSVAARIFEVLQRLAPVVEPVSIDEAYLDMTGCEALYGGLEAMGQAIKQAVREAEQLPCSVGIAPNKFLAKLATEMGKPDGLVVLRQEEVDRLLPDLPVEKLYGVGERGRQVLERHGIRLVCHLRERPLSWMSAQFGQWGIHLYRLAWGIDPRPVEPPSEAKSIGRETTFEEDVTDERQLLRVLAELSASVSRRLRREGLHARTVTLKARYPDFTTLNRSHSFSRPFQDDRTILETARALLEAVPRRPGGFRLIGVQVSGLTHVVQPSLFEDGDPAAPLGTGGAVCGWGSNRAGPASTPARTLPLPQPAAGPRRDEDKRQEEIDRVIGTLNSRYQKRVLTRGVRERRGRKDKQDP